MSPNTRPYRPLEEGTYLGQESSTLLRSTILQILRVACLPHPLKHGKVACLVLHQHLVADWEHHSDKVPRQELSLSVGMISTLHDHSTQKASPLTRSVIRPRPRRLLFGPNRYVVVVHQSADLSLRTLHSSLPSLIRHSIRMQGIWIYPRRHRLCFNRVSTTPLRSFPSSTMRTIHYPLTLARSSISLYEALLRENGMVSLVIPASVGSRRGKNDNL